MFAAVEIEDLAAPVLRTVVQDAGVEASDIDDVILGNAAGPGGNVARLSSLRAGFGVDVPGMTTDRQCGSGLEAIMNACWQIAGGGAEVIVAGGVESISRAPVRGLRDVASGEVQFYQRARFAPDNIGDPEMGVAAENVARNYGISRARQDAYARRSHARASAAQDLGAFADEIVPICDHVLDECIRKSTSATRMAALPAAFVEGGCVTAGNSCPLNDGAAAVVIMSAARARALGHHHALAFVDGAAAGVDPNVLGIGPVASSRKLLIKRPDLSLQDVTCLEFNEAFAAQVLASLDELDLPEELPCQQGGALALGHPFGASGAILVTRLFGQMVRSPMPDTALGMAMIGIGGGLGLTAAFRTVPLN